MLKLYLDEDVLHAPTLEKELNRIGLDVLSTQTAGRAGQGITDPEQLLFATKQERVLVTFNIRDYAKMENHSGILMGEQKNFLSISLLIRALERACRRLTMEEMQDQNRRLEEFR